MTKPKVQNYWYAKLDSKSKQSPYGVTSWYLGNRSFNLKDLIATSDVQIYPIVLNVSGIGTQMGDYVPERSSGSLTLDDSQFSFGFQKKFSDLFDRYEFIEQPISFLFATGRYDAIVSADFSTEFVGIIKRISSSRSGSSTTLNINFEGKQLPKHLLGYRLFNPIPPGGVTDVSFSANLAGQTVPVVFGTGISVEAIYYAGEFVNYMTHHYIYATRFDDDHLNNGPTAFYTPDSRGIHRQCHFASTANYLAYDSTGTETTPPTNYKDKFQAWGDSIDNSTNKYVITGVKARMQSKNDAGWSAGTIGDGDATTFGVAIYRDDLTGFPKIRLAASSITKVSQQTNFRGASAFDVSFNLDKHVVLNEPSNTYYLVLEQTTDFTANGGASDVVDMRRITGSGQTQYRLLHATTTGKGGDTGSSENAWKKKTGLTDRKLYFQIYGPGVTDKQASTLANTSNDGFNVSMIELSFVSFFSWSGVGGNPQLPNSLTNEKFVLTIDGIGSAGAELDPQDVLAILMKRWSGSNWLTNADYSASQYSSTHSSSFTRGVGGFTRQRELVSDTIASICRAMAGRLGVTKGGVFGLWLWGSTPASVARLTDTDCKLLSWDIRGVESIINFVQIHYEPTILNTISEIGFPVAELNNYNESKEYNYLTNQFAKIASTDSYNLFDFRFNRDANFDWAKDYSGRDTGETLARYFLSKFAKPAIIVTIECPLSAYKTIDLLDIVTVSFPELPSHRGTGPLQKEPLYDTGGAVVSLLDGRYLRRAKTYRAQVEGRTISWDGEGVPKLNLTCRLILNNPYDPT